MADTGPPAMYPSESGASQQGETAKEILVPKSDALATFRTLTGIDSAPALSTTDLLRRPAPNLGIYCRVVHLEGQAKLQYRIFAVLINGCLGLQIIVAASLTALGAGKGPHGAVTAFGAVNTIIAGFLTYLNGSGLPHRQKHHQSEWRKVREYIEQRERYFCREGCTLDVENEIYAVERLYENVKGNLETNTDSFVSASDMHNRKGGPQSPWEDPSRPRTGRVMVSDCVHCGGVDEKAHTIRPYDVKSGSKTVPDPYCGVDEKGHDIRLYDEKSDLKAVPDPYYGVGAEGHDIRPHDEKSGLKAVPDPYYGVGEKGHDIRPHDENIGSRMVPDPYYGAGERGHDIRPHDERSAPRVVSDPYYGAGERGHDIRPHDERTAPRLFSDPYYGAGERGHDIQPHDERTAPRVVSDPFHGASDRGPVIQPHDDRTAPRVVSDPRHGTGERGHDTQPHDTKSDSRMV